MEKQIKKKNNSPNQPDLGGRPPIFSSTEELQKKIDAYFKSGFRKKKITTAKGEEIEIPMITITDLAIYLGFESRQSIYDYAEKKDFSYIIKKALFFVEREYEERLNMGNTAGAIFALKNMGWKDKTEVDQTVKADVTVSEKEKEEIDSLLINNL